MTLDENAVTLASYDEGVDTYLAASTREPCLPLLTCLTAVVAPGSQVLEIGSGCGFDAAYLRAHGYQVQTSDASVGFLTYLHAAGWVDAVRYDVDHDDAPEGEWDAIYANAVLHHLRRDRLEPALTRLRRALRPGVVLVASVKTGRADDWSHAKLQAPRWFTYWTADTVRDVFEHSGWHLRQIDTREGRHDDWLDIVAHAKHTS